MQGTRRAFAHLANLTRARSSAWPGPTMYPTRAAGSRVAERGGRVVGPDQLQRGSDEVGDNGAEPFLYDGGTT